MILFFLCVHNCYAGELRVIPPSIHCHIFGYLKNAIILRWKFLEIYLFAAATIANVDFPTQIHKRYQQQWHWQMLLTHGITTRLPCKGTKLSLSSKDFYGNEPSLYHKQLALRRCWSGPRLQQIYYWMTCVMLHFQHAALSFFSARTSFSFPIFSR